MTTSVDCDVTTSGMFEVMLRTNQLRRGASHHNGVSVVGATLLAQPAVVSVAVAAWLLSNTLRDGAVIQMKDGCDVRIMNGEDFIIVGSTPRQ